MNPNRIAFLPASALLLTLTLAACGGGEATDDAQQPLEGRSAGALRAQAQAVSESQRVAAATATASSTTNACAPIKPFYWEIGDRDGRLASSSLPSPGSTITYAATTLMPVASASKWIYGAFAVQRANGNPTAADKKFLTMRSGYVNMTTYCVAGQTVDGCLNYQGNGTYSPESDGFFYYNSGHMQRHASLIGLGSMTSKTLTTAVKAQLGTDLKLAYSTTEVATGVITSADGYARFLRKMMRGELRLGSLLGSSAACTNPLTCADGGREASPAPLDLSWHYSLGHWVEDDPVVGDGAFSSAGSLGFYPWIDAAKTTYGVIARVATLGSGDASAACGRLIRAAWTSGRAQ